MVLALEGGATITEDPSDPGGLTKYGISARGNPELTRDQIFDLTEDQAIEIYKKKYWDRVRGDELPQCLAIAVFDCAVNAGVRTAILILQEITGQKKDGIIGEKTIEAARTGNEDILLIMYQAERNLFYSDTLNFKKYGRGWIRRVSHVSNTYCDTKLRQKI